MKTTSTKKYRWNVKTFIRNMFELLGIILLFLLMGLSGMPV